MPDCCDQAATASLTALVSAEPDEPISTETGLELGVSVAWLCSPPGLVPDGEEQAARVTVRAETAAMPNWR